MKACIRGISVAGPGMSSWAGAGAVLSGTTPWEEDAPLAIDAPALLAPRERRRASPTVRLALSIAEAACADAGLPPHEPATVFASAIGDGKVSTALLTALFGSDKLVSPTHFHNSVHNAAAGYWSQAVGSHAASTSLAASTATFGTALLKALLSVTTEGGPVLLVCYDHPFPEPLHAARPLRAPFGIGLVLTPATDLDAPTLAVEGFTQDVLTPPSMAEMRPLWEGSTAARALPVLEGLLHGGRVVVDVNAALRMALRVTP